MEITISFGNKILGCDINRDIEVEEMSGKGYFYINSTGKIVIMNPTSFWIWKYIADSALIGVNTYIELSDIANDMKKCFEISAEQEKKLLDDIYYAIINLMREDFLLVQE